MPTSTAGHYRVESASDRLLTGHSADNHVVQFYDNEEFLASVVGGFLAAGLAAGEPAVVIATPAHREAFVEVLRQGRLGLGSFANVIQVLDEESRCDGRLMAAAGPIHPVAEPVLAPAPFAGGVDEVCGFFTPPPPPHANRQTNAALHPRIAIGIGIDLASFISPVIRPGASEPARAGDRTARSAR